VLLVHRRPSVAFDARNEQDDQDALVPPTENWSLLDRLRAPLRHRPINIDRARARAQTARHKIKGYSKAHAILVWREDETQLPAATKRLGIGVVTSVGDCLDILTQVDSADAREQPGVMNRVLRLLGLKEPASA